jgi:hypothetical protein
MERWREKKGFRVRIFPVYTKNILKNSIPFALNTYFLIAGMRDVPVQGCGRQSITVYLLTLNQKQHFI